MHTPTCVSPHPRRAAAALLLASAVVPLSAADMGGVAVHGSASATAAWSDTYNYLGDTRETLDLNQTELILNATKLFDSGLKLAAQLYAYEFAGYEDVTVDFANLDYSFRREFGVRAGRNKTPSGFYNEAQDIDQVRVFASLPLNYYPKAGRAFGANFDGVTLYGNLDVRSAGNLDYQLCLGAVQPLDEEMPFARSLRALDLDFNRFYGGSLVWNTPVAGLRAGYTYDHFPSIDYVSAPFVPVMPPLIAEVEYGAHTGSVEYTREKWTFVAEYKRTENIITAIGAPVPPVEVVQEHVYLQADYQATEQIGLGVYHAWSAPKSGGTDRDLAFAASYRLQPWWLVKAEIHLMDGIHNLGVAADSNPGATDETWRYLVLKTTFSF